MTASAPVTAALLAAAVSLAPLRPAQDLPAPLLARLDSLVRDGEPGLSLCVAQNGAITATAARGLADLERGIPMTPQTPVYIASLAKEFTAVAVLQLVEQRRVGLDDRVRAFLPDLPAYLAPVTVRHLLSHTGGVPDYEDALEAVPGVTNRTVLEWLGRQDRLSSDPGTRWQYSNAGFVVLAELFSRVSGQPLAAFMQARFDSLGMTSTFVYTPETQSRARAIGYRLEGPNWVRDDYSAFTIGPGGVYSSAEDMCRWGLALDSGKLLKRMTVIAAQSVHVTSLATPTPMGLGFQVEDIPKGPLAGEWYAAMFGLKDGFRAVNMKLKSRPFRYVQLSNSSRWLEPLEVPNLSFSK